ncbi:MAG: 30S ribosomal protein S13 [Spirochaetes bacterium GWF1_31_7]|nr:MAG: 30S ribosomal protein S13 [Spirochaetes bacterium GWE1_32_154]OHD47301.1 MAG: 30S ribosomal protein S13 [Spirochaetes bacterium GWE2_31_10]OHD47360.1 MAG: 30S ribosomal protein S13 [Spirochaetes bacterium GWF1_31_7]OHD74815.1 MAG: 30S ribosomal protein S13 [Spirochaetes bacterium RIFOXYB1_FULL_32_8]HBD92812.1 30S ribosomal protein S13 [Spirochaetia bacterium]
MARIAGIELPNKPIEIALTYIYGIGRQNSLVILEKAGIKLGTRTNDLTESEINEIRKILENEYMIEGKLRSFVQLNIKRLMDIGCYRGLRHRKGLPARGQRTKTNARTRKGRKKTVANKKK